MTSNCSLTTVVYLIFNQCKQTNTDFADADKIIEYITNNFDYNTEEADQLQFNELFKSLKTESKLQNNLLSKEDFEKVLKKWIPSVVDRNENSSEEPQNFNNVVLGNTQNRLSRSLTNLKQQIDHEQRINYYDIWCSRQQDYTTDNENVYEECHKSIFEDNELRPKSISPHEDPFRIPLNFIRSTPIKNTFISSEDIGFLQQPNLRYIKHYKDPENNSFSDTELSKYESSLFEGDCFDHIDQDRNRGTRKRHRSSIVGQTDGESRDLISQIRQIKFKNDQLVEINNRLQSQLELAEENIKNLSSKYMDLEKKNKYFTILNDENQQLIIEIDDIRKCVESEVELKRRIQSEKIMTESELTAAKEHIQSLMDRLSMLDAGLEEKDKIVTNLKSMISQQEEFCLKLQEINSEKDEELQKNQKGIRELTDAICEYEEKIQIISKQKDDLENKYLSSFNRNILFPLNGDTDDDHGLREISCGEINGDHTRRCTTQSEFKPNSSIKVELASELIESSGGSPLCEKLYLDDDLVNDSSLDSSMQMLNVLMSMISSLHGTLVKYREDLEDARRHIKTNEYFSDEISLSYLACLNNSISLLSVSTEKALSCQQQFNDTFNLLMKRISVLRNEKEELILRNKNLILQINESSSSLDNEIVEKMGFLEEQLRLERLSNLKKDKEIVQLKRTKENVKYGICPHCERTTSEFDFPDEMFERNTEVLGLDESSNTYGKQHFAKRRFTITDIPKERKIVVNGLMKDSNLTRISSASLGDLNIIINSDESVRVREPGLSPNRYTDQELEMYRNYNMSTDNLSIIPRYKISRANTCSVDIEDLIENSWLEQPSKLEERRASVFVQNDLDLNHLIDPGPNVSSNALVAIEIDKADKMRSRNRTSSCSSSNDTSDGNSIDSLKERIKLAQQLENRTMRMQSRSPAPTLLNSSLVHDDLKSLTPTFNELEQGQRLDEGVQFAGSYLEDISVNQYSQSEPSNLTSDLNVTSETLLEDLLVERRQSAVTTLPQTTNNCNEIDQKIQLPKISIIEPALSDLDDKVISERKRGENNDHRKINSSLKIIQPSTDVSLDSEFFSIPSSMNKSNISSCASSIVGEEMRSKRFSSKLRPKRMSRPHTITGIGLNSVKSKQDDFINSFDESSSFYEDLADIQDAIDILNETSRSLVLISSEDLENKFSETMMMYHTDRPTILDRAIDANNKCNRALTNVEQEFNILRHLIKNVSLSADQPCDMITRIRTSINVLEKCVEYLSAKSENLGSIQQEIKLSCLLDVFQEYSSKLQKDRETHLRELEELRSSIGLLNEIGINNSIDQGRQKRSALAGKTHVNIVGQPQHPKHHLLIRSDTIDAFDYRDPKTRFQLVAQNTAMKTSFLRQLANSTRKKSDQVSTPDLSSHESSKYDHKMMSTRSSTTQLSDSSEVSRKIVEDDNFKSRKFTVGKYFSNTHSKDDSEDNIYQRGLAQGLRMSTDQALCDLRAQQSKFSASLDALSDMIEDGGELTDDDKTDARVDTEDFTGFQTVRDQLWSWLTGLRSALSRMVYMGLGIIVMVGLLLPWIFIPASPDETSISEPASRRRSFLFTDQSDPTGSDRTDQSTGSASTGFLSSVNVVRHHPATV